MKTLILLLLLSTTTLSQLVNDDDCGIFIPKDTFTEWETFDTISFNFSGDTTWVYRGWEDITVPPNITLVNCLCCFRDNIWENRKVNRRGVQQRQWHITGGHYEERAKTKYERLIDSLLLNCDSLLNQTRIK